MKDNIKRILIIDDGLRARVDEKYLFKNADFESEVFIAHNLETGLTKLEEWARSGHRADIVDCDHYVHVGNVKDFPRIDEFGGNGSMMPQYIMKWAEKYEEQLRPAKYFMHSNAMAEIRNNTSVETHSVQEFIDIANFGEGNPSLGAYRSDNLRQYLNKNFGTKYPLTDADLDAFHMESSRLERERILAEIAQGDLHYIRAFSMAKEYDLPPENLFANIDFSNLHHSFGSIVDTNEAAKDPKLLSAFKSAIAFEKESGGAISGFLAFSEEEAHDLHKQGKKAIVALKEFNPLDTKLLSVADGIILFGKGIEHLEIDVANHNIPALMNVSDNHRYEFRNIDGQTQLSIGDSLYKEGDAVTIAGLGVGMMRGTFPIKEMPFLSKDGKNRTKNKELPFETILDWANDARKKHGGMIVKANADTPRQIAEAIRLGAQGVGLLRTENMFVGDKLSALQQALISGEPDELEKLGKLHRTDFCEIFKEASKAKNDFPITIRLLDTLPTDFFSSEQVAQLEKRAGAGNTRGAQLAVHTPNLYKTQAEAIFAAAKETGYSSRIDIMIPMVRTSDEMKVLKKEVEAAAKHYGVKNRYTLRAMIETRDAVKNTGEIAKLVDGISFGTNDLTADVMNGIKRNDVDGIKQWSVDNNHIGRSPFLTLSKPVLHLMKESTEAARRANPDIDVGICGNQASADVPSIKKCHEMRLNSISVPTSEACLLISRIISAQTAAKDPREMAGFSKKHAKRNPLKEDKKGSDIPSR